MSLIRADTAYGEYLKAKAISELQLEYDGMDHRDIFSTLINFEELKMLEPYPDSHRHSRTWYPYMPSFGSKEFPGFLVSSRELVLYVCDDKLITLRVWPVPTAAADREDHAIVLPTHIFDSPGWRIEPHEIDFSPPVHAEIATATMNGVLLHEAAHFAQSYETISKMYSIAAGAVEKPTSWFDKNPYAATVFNVVEDIFNEDWLKRTFPSYVHFIEASHNFYFHDLELKHRLLETYGSIMINPSGKDEDPLWQIDGGQFLNVLIMLKNWRFQIADLWGGHIRPYALQFLEAKGMHSKLARAELAYEITKNLTDDPMLYLQPESMTGLEGEEGEIDSMDNGGRSITVLVIDQEDLSKASEAADRKVDIDEIKKKFEEDEIIILVKTERHSVGNIPPARRDTPHEAPTKGLSMDKRFAGLGRMLRRSLTHNDAPGEPLKKGQVLVGPRLYRIATDNKIFTQRERRKATGRDYEIIILVDCSGSMSGDKVREALSVGTASWFSLKSARVRATLLGHSTTNHPIASECPRIWLFGLPTDPLDRVLRRATTVATGSGVLRNNIDGHALLAAAEYFSDKPTRKWLFHISDGQPAGSSYSGDAANAHTALCATRIRKRGIDVVSITIERGIWRVNDRIYGKNKNVKTESPYVLKELIEAMFKKGAQNVEDGY